MKKGSVFIIIAGVLWGTMGLFVRTFTQRLGFTSGQTSAIRITAAALMFAAFLAAKDKKLFKIRLKDAWVFVCLGFFGIFCMANCYFKSMSSGTSMSVSAILLYTAPIIVMLTSCLFFGERFTKKKLAALLSAFVGCVFVSLGADAKVTVTGFVFGLLSGAAYASYSIFGKIALERGYSPYTVSAYAFISAAVFSVLFGKPTEIVKIFVTLPQSTVYVAALVVLCALVTAFLPFLFYTKGLESTKAGKAAVMASVEPLAATVCGIFAGEPITASALCGIICIIFAITVLNTSKGGAEKRQTKSEGT